VKTSTYWGCGTRLEGSNCTNGRTISTKSYEQRVLAGLKDRMLDPEMVSIFVKEYHEERAKQAASSRREAATLNRRLAEATAKVDRLVAAIAAGAGEFQEVRDALTKAKADRDLAQSSLDALEAMPVVALHPTVAADYRHQMDDLHAALANPDARAQAIPAIRG
jgi:hypothetical protein